MKEYERGWFGWRKGNTKDIIEDTQEAVKRLADAQNVTVSAMQKALSFQKKLAEASKYLFGLGCANITTNRIAVRAIEMKLKGASGAKISELARQEMMAVVRQLKEQEDILKKQEFLTSKVQENVSRLDEKDQIDAEQTQRLDELSSLLTKKDEVDQKQEDAISANKKAIEKNTEALTVLFEYTKQKDILDKEQTEEIEKIKKSSERKLCIVAIVLSLFALFCGAGSIILQFIK